MKINEYQSAGMPIDSTGNEPSFTRSSATDILGNKYEYQEVDSSLQDDYYVKSFIEWLEEKSYNDDPLRFIDKTTNSDFIADYAYQELMDENVAAAVAPSVSGMGAVVSPQASSVPGQTIGSNTVGASFGQGGVVGSGDIGSGWKNSNIIPRKENSRRKNKAKAQLKKFSKNIKSFGEYQK